MEEAQTLLIPSLYFNRYYNTQTIERSEIERYFILGMDKGNISAILGTPLRRLRYILITLKTVNFKFSI